MINSEKIYLKLPNILRQFAVNYEGWRIQRSRYNRKFWDVLSDVESRTYYSEADIHTYRDRRLHGFIKHCANTVPYYQRMFNKLHIDPNSIKTIKDLSCIPILSKTDVQKYSYEMVSKVIPERQKIIVHTSGTTGAGLQFATTLAAIRELWAVWWRSRHWCGIHHGTWCGYFGGRSIIPMPVRRRPFWVCNYPGKQILFSAYHINKETSVTYIDELRRRQPPWLHGYPSVLALMAYYILEYKIELGYPIKWITVSSENLLSGQAKLIKEAFGIRPIQDYGMTEAVASFSECELGNLHVDEDFAATEFIPTSIDSKYRVIGTNFTNFATPMLRYDSGDIVSLCENKCGCGKPGRLITSVDGRHEDYVVLKNGSKVGRMDHAFKDMINIKEAQIYQKAAGEIELKIVKGSKYTSEDENTVLKEICKRLGDETKISIHYLDQIPRSKAGKLRFVVSDIAGGKLI